MLEGAPRRGERCRTVSPRGHRLRRCTMAGRKSSLEAGKRRLAGDTARAATSDEVKDLRHGTQALKEVVADLTSKTDCSKSMIADGGDEV